MHIEPFYDPVTATMTYVVSDPKTGACAVIDSVLDYNDKTGETSTASAERVATYIRQRILTTEWILETHIHADHLTASAFLKKILGGKTAIGSSITKVLDYWVPELKLENVPLDGSQFDRLFADGETFSIGSLAAKIIFTPGHTPACACYLIGDALFVGDTLFMPYGGTSRADFPGGDAATLYRSIQKIFALPDATRIFVCHDYPPQGEKPRWETTVGEEKKNNKMVGGGVSEEEYVRRRTERDKTLSPPRLILPSLKANLRAGKI